MGKKYICEVKRDNNNNELELVNTNNFNTIPGGVEGSIRFKDNDEMHRYFNRYCISEKELQNSGGGIFMFLFFLLLLICIINLLCKMMKNGASTNVKPPSAFGRFSF